MKYLFVLIALLLVSGCAVNEKSCTADSDCACGTHIKTGECFYGNAKFVNVSKQCPDFCTGIAAMFETKCVDKECRQVRIR
jgi:hypothetical protein